MPTITIDYNDLCQLLGKRLDLDRIAQDLAAIKCEIESIEGTEITIEVTPDRPDLFSTAGIAVALGGLRGDERGLPKVKVKRGEVVVMVDKDVVSIRPFAGFSEVRGLQLSDEAVRQIMQLQEKLHETYCRKRRRVSIGIHDRGAIAPLIRYTALRPDEIRFIPLDERREMTGSEILSLTSKGVQYGSIIKDFDRYPLILDENGVVLSMPPIINSIHTVVTPSTRNVFVDVTGTDRVLVDDVLAVVTLALVRRGEEVRTVKVIQPDEVVWTPKLIPTERELDLERVKDVLGIPLSATEVENLLLKMRYGISLRERGRLRVLVPPGRRDVLHEIDLIEDVLMGYGYNRVKPETPSIATIGGENEIVEVTRKARDLMVGLGFQEVVSYMMTNKKLMFTKMRLKPERVVEVENPASLTYSILRNWLLPCLLEFLSVNRHHAYPQRIFECGDIVAIDERMETRTKSVRKLAAAMASSKVGYEDIQAVLYSLLPNLGIDGWTIRAAKHGSFIDGRCASVLVGGRSLCILGEIDPEVISNFELEMPVAGFEMDISRIFELLQKPRREGFRLKSRR